MVLGFHKYDLMGISSYVPCSTCSMVSVIYLQKRTVVQAYERLNTISWDNHLFWFFKNPNAQRGDRIGVGL